MAPVRAACTAVAHSAPLLDGMPTWACTAQLRPLLLIALCRHIQRKRRTAGSQCANASAGTSSPTWHVCGVCAGWYHLWLLRERPVGVRRPFRAFVDSRHRRCTVQLPTCGIFPLGPLNQRRCTLGAYLGTTLPNATRLFQVRRFVQPIGNLPPLCNS
jgi:hypothetical protein